MSETKKYKIEKLTSKRGMNYFGIVIPKEIISEYIEKLKEIDKDNFELLIDNQQKRDGNYHITVITLTEYSQNMGKNFQKLIKEVEFELRGIGKIKKENNVVYYIIVDSKEIMNLRNQLSLSNIDLHITIGFKENDIHGISKDISTKIKKI